MESNTGRNRTKWQFAVAAAAAAVLAGAPAAHGGGQEAGKRIERDVMVLRAEKGVGVNDGILEAARQAPTLQVIPFDNPADAPIAITEAELKSVPAEQFASSAAAGPHTLVFKRRVATPDGEAIEPHGLEPAEGEEGRMRVRRFPQADADGNVAVMLVTITNVSDRAIEGYQFGSAPEGESKKSMRFYFHKPVEPGASETFAIPVFGGHLNADNMVLRPTGVRYADGTTWGEVGSHDRFVIRTLSPSVEVH